MSSCTRCGRPMHPFEAAASELCSPCIRAGGGSRSKGIHIPRYFDPSPDLDPIQPISIPSDDDPALDLTAEDLLQEILEEEGESNG